MSAIAEMDVMIDETIDMIINGNGINESVDAQILYYDLTDSELRGLIYYLAQRGYRYTNKGA